MSAPDISPIPRLASHARFRAENVAVVYEGRSIDYGELYRIAGRLAAGLRADGVGHGDRVAYLGLNSASFLITYLAAAWVGAAFIPVNFRLAAPEVRFVLEDSRPDVVIAEPAHAALIDGLDATVAVRRLLLVDDDPAFPAPAELTAHWQSYSAFATAQAEPVPATPLVDDDLAALLYTSGTTGRSKGVMLTMGNLWWNWINVDSVVDTRVDDVYLAIAPLFHIGGLNALALRTLTRGGTIVVRRGFDAAEALQDLVRFRVNTLFVVPAMLTAIQRQPDFDDADLSALRSTIAAGAPVPPSLIASYAKKGVCIQQAWGLTETAPFATYLEAGKTMEKLGSCGTPMPYTEVKIVDPETLREAPVGATGEMWVRGPNVAAGYWNNPEATDRSFTADRWFRTGDLGYADADGYFFIVDRLKDMVISGGENVYPAEIENVLMGHPEVADVAVIGVPDEKWGEAVCAVLSQTVGAQPLTLDEVRDYAGAYLARYKLPTRLVTIDSLPRNGAGKLDKPLIREIVGRLETARIEQVASLTTALDLTLPSSE